MNKPILPISTIPRFLSILFFTLISWISLGDMAIAKEAAGVEPEFLSLIAQCAPTVRPETMAAIIAVESHGNQFAIADAGPVRLPWKQRKLLVKSYFMGSIEAATAKALELIADGHTVSLGLSQVNDRNLPRLGLTVRDMFDPCKNLAVGGKIMTDFYDRALKAFGPGERALRAAISAYNSGDWMRGEREGYVDLVYQQFGKPLAMNSKIVTSPAVRGTSVKNSVAVAVASVPNISNVGYEASGPKFSMSARDFVVSE